MTIALWIVASLFFVISQFFWIQKGYLTNIVKDKIICMRSFKEAETCVMACHPGFAFFPFILFWIAEILFLIISWKIALLFFVTSFVLCSFLPMLLTIKTNNIEKEMRRRKLAYSMHEYWLKLNEEIDNYDKEEIEGHI